MEYTLSTKYTLPTQCTVKYLKLLFKFYYTSKVVFFKKSLCNIKSILVLKNCKICLKLVGKFIARY